MTSRISNISTCTRGRTQWWRRGRAPHPGGEQILRAATGRSPRIPCREPALQTCLSIQPFLTQLIGKGSHWTEILPWRDLLLYLGPWSAAEWCSWASWVKWCLIRDFTNPARTKNSAWPSPGAERRPSTVTRVRPTTQTTGSSTRCQAKLHWWRMTTQLMTNLIQTWKHSRHAISLRKKF